MLASRQWECEDDKGVTVVLYGFVTAALAVCYAEKCFLRRKRRKSFFFFFRKEFEWNVFLLDII